MQCNQPFWGTGNANGVQLPPLQTNPYYSEIIGDGDVMTLMLPDGTMQSYFVPINRFYRSGTITMNPYSSNGTPVWSNPNNVAWFVRSVLNTFPALGGCNQIPNNCGDPIASAYANINTTYQDAVQKFHYDSCTSTSDLHYFYPHLRHDWIKSCAAVQVEVPQERSIYHYGITCNKPCYCGRKSDVTETGSDCVGGTRIETTMSVDEIKSDNVTKTCCGETRKRKKSQNKNKKQHWTSSDCHCYSEVDTLDKLVTTYTDQASSCTDIKGRESQTYNRNIETEQWYPKKGKKSKNYNTNSPKRSARGYDGTCYLCSPCSDSDESGTHK